MLDRNNNKLASLAVLLGVAQAQLPCDIMSSAGTPCVAAHSTVRSLYESFDGSLYQVLRNSDGTTTDIPPLSAGGVANAAMQDSFCANTTCVINVIYDQSGNSNNLAAAPAGGNSAGPVPGGGDNTAGATGAPIYLNGQKAYGVFISPGTGYRIDDTTGVATGNDAQSIYAVFDGTHYNDGCCFDYGNAESNNDDDGDATMNSIYFGTNTVWGKGAGNGPWVMADLENGLYAQGSYDANNNDPAQSNRFVTAVVKGETSNFWEIRGGNAQSGDLTTYYGGERPSGYYPMKQQGSIILGIGGDNSNGAQGTFYEGALTASFVSDDTDNSIQENIVNAGYAVAPLTSGPAVNVGSSVTIRATTPGFQNRYIWQNVSTSNNNIDTQVITSSSSSDLQAQGTWKVVTGLGNSGCVSFESTYTPGYYIRHYAFELYTEQPDGSMQFEDDATFCPEAAFNNLGTNSIRSWSYPTRFFRHYADVGYIASEGGPEFFDSKNEYNNDVSFVISSGFIS